MPKLSRRQFLSAAGGTTLLAVTPLSRSLWAALQSSPLRPNLPLLTALPYVQPGNASRLVAGEDRRVLAWQTEAKPADFVAEFGPTEKYGQVAPVRCAPGVAGGEARLLYQAHLDGLPLGRKMFYRVKCNGEPVVAGYFTTRQGRGHNIRFVAFGDNSWGGAADRAIAYQAFGQHPDFVVNAGDNVYDSGLLGQYEKFFFPAYNAAQNSPLTGSPLLSSVPFYTVLGNHDVRGKDANNHFAANFDQNADSLGYFCAMHLPLNGPVPNHPPLIAGTEERLRAFCTTAGDRYPRMANYSFDWGDAHFCCLDSNVHIDPTDAVLQSWIEHDLTHTDARWKFVVFHHPPFNIGRAHYGDQHMRALAPLFERCGVDFVLSGHEHTYQRPRPFRFEPQDLSRAKAIHEGNRFVPGTFHIDRRFDDRTVTKPDGIFYITTGAGGASLHDSGMSGSPNKWTHAEDGHADYMVRFISDHHSLSVFDITGDTLCMKQVDETGHEIDRLTVTKA